jgi:hypothetical protein
LIMLRVSSALSELNLPNASALSSPSPRTNVLCTGYGTGVPRAEVACSFGTNTDSPELSVEAVVSTFAVLTLSVETRISMLCARRTLEGA